ncbi:methyl-accepting chemotaxis protein [Thermocoleostomius sinensis]|uniref:Methyl-accepting transducer domain-containing protein n=1 Tax=Thermocoleostomius sinensis A174 TaxID=2016057 RepID=A0A9E8ZHH2_9CYAN|nr:hypothetical protein [Thermocoleostomius sinensis]WAL61904.1 hypothetical protein OXH18_07950 [Thermocoleostomius sinensis A174]
MTSTPQESQSSQSYLFDRNQRPLQSRQRSQPRWRFRFLGFRVFFPVIGSALLGIAGIAFLCGEVVKYQAEEEIQTILSSKVHLLDSTLMQADTLATAFRSSLLTLHSQNAKNSDTYQKLTLELFKSRPKAVAGLGFGQSQNGLLPEQRWLFSYFFLNSNDPNAAGQPLPAPNESIRYVDGTQPGNFYPDSDRYRDFFLPQIDLWTLPYHSANGLQTSYYSPIFNDRGKWLGTVFVDVDGAFLQEALAGSALNDRGYFALLTPEGQVVSAPETPVGHGEDYRSIAGLDAVWLQMAEGQSGLIEGEKGYWAYARPQNQWLMVAFVPYEAVFNQLAWIGIGGMATVTGLLLLILVLALQSFKRRLRPLLDECDRLKLEQESVVAAQDEIAQISETFFQLLERVKANETQLQQDATQIQRLEAQLKQVAIVELEQKTLEAEVEHLFNVVDSVEQGDLLVAAQVRSQKMGLVADTLNRLIRRLGQTMSYILNVTNDVTQAIQPIKQHLALVTDSTRVQQQETDRIQTAIDQIRSTAQETTLEVMAATETIETTRAAIRAGQPAIEAMMQSIDLLQQGTSQLIKRSQTLSNYVELTTQFAKEQKRIAAMTRVLAANASMLASRAAGQQDPEQFAVITREFETIATQINQLASQTNQSLGTLKQRTEQIQTVVSGLDYDIQAMSQQIDQFDTGVERSQQLLDHAELISDCMAHMKQQCLQSHQAISAAAETTIASIQQMIAIADETLHHTDLSQAQTQQIEQQMHALQHQVKFFQLQPVQRQAHQLQLVEAAASSKPSDR